MFSLFLYFNFFCLHLHLLCSFCSLTYAGCSVSCFSSLGCSGFVFNFPCLFGPGIYEPRTIGRIVFFEWKYMLLLFRFILFFEFRIHGCVCLFWKETIIFYWEKYRKIIDDSGVWILQKGEEMSISFENFHTIKC